MQADKVEILEFDVVIVGSGFAGLRAGYSAVIEAPFLKVGVISLGKGLTGASFKNMNKMVGMQVLVDRYSKDLFVKRAEEIARPGDISLKLVNILAEESCDRFYELLEMGVKFKLDENNNIARFKGCFLSEIESAVIIYDLPHTFFCFLKKLKGSVVFLSPFILLKILTFENRVAGIVTYDLKNRKLVGINTRCIVMAIGGCASIFRWTNSWSHPFCGYSLSLLEDAKVELINQGFIQILWLKTHNMEFFSPAWLDSFPEDLRSKRQTHCPIGYLLEDFKLDGKLLQKLGRNGVSIENGRESFFVAPYIQAQNGGAKIDVFASTNIKGLFACGECASNMHGANRIGGAMILSSQVFGHRAGKYAAIYAIKNAPFPLKVFSNLMNDFVFEIERYFAHIVSKDTWNLLKERFSFGEDCMIRALLLGDEKILNRILEEIEDIKNLCDSHIDFLKLKSLKVLISGRLRKF